MQEELIMELIRYKQRLTELPELAEAKLRDIIREKLSLNNINGEIKKIENMASMTVTNATGEDGKKAYTNETSRGIAVADLLDKNTMYQELKNKAIDTDTRIRVTEAEYERITMEFTALKMNVKIFELINNIKE